MNDIEFLKLRNGTRLIEFCFLRVFNRYPLKEEAERYLNRLKDSISIPELLHEIGGSQSLEELEPPENENLLKINETSTYLIEDFEKISDDDFVDAIYQRSLGRRPDVDGKKFYCDALSKGKTRLQLAVDLTNSAEGQQYKLIINKAKDYIKNQGDPKLSFAANIFSRRFHAIVEGLRHANRH